MKLTINSTTLEPKSVVLRPTYAVLRTPRGQRYAQRKTIDVEGCIFGDDQSTLITNISALISLLSSDGFDFSYQFNDGTNTPDMTVLNSQCIGNTRVVNMPALDPRNMGEYSTYWDYKFSIEADVAESGLSINTIYSFRESITVNNGAGQPQTGFLPQTNNPYQAQQNRRFSQVTATQEGEVCGLLKYLPQYAQRARWPQWLVNDPGGNGITQESPRQAETGRYLVWPISWRYSFESNQPLGGSSVPAVL